MTKTKKLSEPGIGSIPRAERKTNEASERASKKQEARVEQELTVERRKMVVEIGQIHDDLRATTKLTVAKAIQLGERLTKLKKEVGHGEWLPFVARYLPIDERTAARYMKVYRNRVALSDKFDSVSNTAVSEAYEALTRSKKNAATEEVHEPVDDPVTDSPGDREPADIMTEIQRTVADHLEDLPTEMLIEFETDLHTFLEHWMETHQQEVAT